MTAKKTLAIITYLAYATFLILFITFGSGSANIVADIAEDIIMKRDIEDVTVDVAEGREFLAANTYYIEFTAHGDFWGSSGLIFTSLDPDYVTISSKGALKCNTKFEGDSFDGRVKVTSRYDDDFEKIFTFRFVKRYPNNFVAKYYVKGYGNGGTGKDVQKIYTGVPVYVTSDTTNSNSFNLSTYTILYDNEYFDKADDGGFIPKKPTPEGVKLTFSVVYENGKTDATSPFVICDPDKEYTEIDDVKFIYSGGKNEASLDNHTITRNSRFIVKLYNDGEQVISDYKLTCDGSGMKESKNGSVYFTSIGEKHLTFTLPNGFEYKCVVNVKNIIKLPTIANDTVKETHVIEMMDTDVKTFKLNYSSSVTYKNVKYVYDSSLIKVTSYENGFTVTGKQHGTTTLKIILDDGITRVEDEYTIEIEENKDTKAMLLKNLSMFVAKVLGHMTLFILLGVFAVNMLMHLDGIDKWWHKLLIYVLSGLPAAVITELIQLFMPGRSGRFADIGIDLAGYLIGTVVFLITYAVLKTVAVVDRD